MPATRTTTAKPSLEDRVNALANTVATLADAVGSLVALQSTPAKPVTAKAATAFRTKADIAAGRGWSCTCGRTDLKEDPQRQPKAGERIFHLAPDKSTHVVSQG